MCTTPTPPKTNMEPENGGPLEKEIPIGNHHFQVPAVNFWGCMYWFITSLDSPKPFGIFGLLPWLTLLYQGGGRQDLTGPLPGKASREPVEVTRLMVVKSKGSVPLQIPLKPFRFSKIIRKFAQNI